MDASRYFEEMHRAMSAQKNNSSLAALPQRIRRDDRAIPHPGRKPAGQRGLFRLHPG